MKIQTKYFGEIETSEDEKIHFPGGIFGFETPADFLIIRFEDDNDAMLCLQSAADERLAFVLLNPFYICENYAPKLSDSDLESLNATEATPMLVYAIAVVRENFEESTINLKCPVVVNAEAKIARQVILDTGEYPIKHPLSAVKKG